MNNLEIVSLALQFLSLMIMTACLYSSLSDNYIYTKRNKYIVVLVETIVIMLITDIPTYFLEGIGGSNFYNHLLSFFSYAACVFSAMIYSVYIYNYISTEINVPKNINLVSKILTIFAILAWLILSFNSDFFYIDDLGFSHEGNIYWISQLPIILMLGFQCIFVVINASRITKRKVFLILVYCFIPITGVFINSFWELDLRYVAISFSVLLLYLMIHQDELIRSVEQEKELTMKNAELIDSKTKVMISQIQPHFMYNTLNAIYYLIEKDPVMAQKAVNVFSEYLRMNIDTLSISAPVPFEKEMKHIETYLWIEKLRFDDELTIVYDINCKDFFVPALSIQPFVENAIKHGICKKAEGGTLTFRTFEEGGSAVIEIIDDGVGFDVNIKDFNDGREHVGVANSKQRLSEQVNASVRIESEPGKGTTVRIIVPNM